MEKSANIEDQVMDNLLRSYIKQQKQPEINCDGFDPDLANLYLERVLTEKETGRYEIHLSECSPCRSNVIALAQFAEQEVPLALVASAKAKQAIVAPIADETRAVEKSNANWFEGLKGFFALLMTPRYALGAVAALVLAISIPVILSQQSNKTSNAPNAAASGAKSAEDNGAPGVIAQAPAATPNDGLTTDNGSGELRREPQAQSERDRAASPESTNQSASGLAGAGIGSTAGEPPATSAVAAESSATTEKKEVAKNESTTVADNKPRADENAVKPTEAPAATPPPAVAKATERPELPRIDSKETLKIPSNDKDTASGKTLKPGTADTSVASATKPTGPTIRPNEGVRPSAPSTESGGRALTDKAKSLRSASDARKEPVRASASRKIDNKTFWLIDDVWTDKDYKKDKELPVVTLTKESDVYKEVLEKHSNLQKFFKGFAANEKVIVVYKGTVYRLMP